MAIGQAEIEPLKQLVCSSAEINNAQRNIGACKCGRHQFQNRALDAGHSIAELRYEIQAGRDAKALGNYELALKHFQSAARAAMGFAQLAHKDCFNADCAARALFESRQGVAMTLFELGRESEATKTAEQLFDAMCTGAVLQIGSTCYRAACLHHLTAARDIFLLFLYLTKAPEERCASVSDVTKRILQAAQRESLAV